MLVGVAAFGMPGPNCPPGCASNCTVCLATIMPFSDSDLETFDIKSLIIDLNNLLQDAQGDPCNNENDLQSTKYYLPENFKLTFDGFSILHVNIRSIASNFTGP